MKTIHKYVITPKKLLLEMPKGAEILTVQSQHESACIWALVDSEAPLEDRHFDVVGTGQPIEETGIKRKYIGTFQLGGGALVYHLFEKYNW